MSIRPSHRLESRVSQSSKEVCRGAGFSGVGSPPGRGHRRRCGGHAGGAPPRTHRAPARHRGRRGGRGPRGPPRPGHRVRHDRRRAPPQRAGRGHDRAAAGPRPLRGLAGPPGARHRGRAGHLRAASSVRPLPRRDPRRCLRPGRCHGVAAPRPRRGRRACDATRTVPPCCSTTGTTWPPMRWSSPPASPPPDTPGRRPASPARRSSCRTRGRPARWTSYAATASAPVTSCSSGPASPWSTSSSP